MAKKQVGRPSFIASRQLGTIARYGMAWAILCLVGLGRAAGERRRMVNRRLNGMKQTIARGALKYRVVSRRSCKKAFCVIWSAIRSRRPAIDPAIWKKPGFYGTVLVLIILATGAFYLDQKRAEAHYGPLRLAGQQVAAAAADSKLLSGSLANVRLGAGKKEPEIGQACGDTLPARATSGETADQASPGKDSPVTDDADRGASSDIISIARRFMGRPYCYGADGTASFDCSGFVSYVYSSYGISLPRVASDQARAGRRVASPAPGDLVFFSDRRDGYITHVGIYIGNNSFIHASFQGVTITSLDDPWYKERYVMACRVI